VPGTGGLLCEPGLLRRRDGFDRAGLLQTLGTDLREGAQLVLLFCYANPALPGWLAAWSAAATPTWLWLAPGLPAREVGHWLGTQPQPGQRLQRGALTVQALPYVAQTRFDELLWSADLNLVRGEDSLVRALWAGRPFVWQIYPQQDGVHAAKLAAFLDLYLAQAPAALATAVRGLHAQWNGTDGTAALPSPPLAAAGPAGPGTALPWPAWRQHALAWGTRQAGQSDLAGELLHFASSRRNLQGG
jgi:uncharacterized repeat protein (TIGR03837 family)